VAIEPRIDAPVTGQAQVHRSQLAGPHGAEAVFDARADATGLAKRWHWDLPGNEYLTASPHSPDKAGEQSSSDPGDSPVRRTLVREITGTR
jgi:hypothetical protein